jgi:hypothetical protein
LAAVGLWAATATAAVPPTDVCPRLRDVVALSVTTGRVARSEPEYSFCVYGLVEDNGVAWLGPACVYTKRGRLVQVLSYPEELQTLGLFSEAEFRSGWPAPELEDLNFDGYLDVKLLAYVGGTGNYGFHVWMYKPTGRQFVYEPFLSEKGRLKADPKTRTLTSSWVMGAGTNGSSSIRWISGRPVVVKEEVLDWNKERSCQELVIRERRRGRLVVTREGCVGEDDHP